MPSRSQRRERKQAVTGMERYKGEDSGRTYLLRERGRGLVSRIQVTRISCLYPKNSSLRGDDRGAKGQEVGS